MAHTTKLAQPDRLPLVSVVVPTYNRTAFLRDAVRSVLAQTYADWELIVVDDGSTDSTRDDLAAIQDARVRVIERAHCGRPAVLRNVALGVARGSYVAFLDSDDMWLPEKLGRQVTLLRASHGCRWSYTWFSRIDAAGAPTSMPGAGRCRPVAGWIVRDLLAGRACVALPTVMVESAFFTEVGRFDESLRFMEDYEAWLRLALAAPVAYVPDSLARVRSHPGNTGRGRLEVAEDSALVYARALGDARFAAHRRLCARQYVKARVALADRHRGRGEYRVALRTLFEPLRPRLTVWRWWVALFKTCLRPMLPPPVIRRYRRWRGFPAGQ